MSRTLFRVRGKVHFALSFLFICILTNSYAQSKINGVVVDINNQPLGDATVLLLKTKDSSLVKGTTTTKAGQYSFADIGTGSYLVASSHVNYKQVYSNPFLVNAGQSGIDLADLRLTEKETQLSDVRVSAKKPLFEQKLDRMVVNVAGSINAAGSTALEVLEKSPGIVIDRQNNGITLNGKAGVVIMINGRISRMPAAAVLQMLSGMSSSNIEKIELITTPPANFDAEGNAGYINIVLKSNTQYGTNGSFSITGGYAGGGPITAADMNFNHRRGKVNLYGNYSFSRRDFFQVFSFYRQVKNQGKTIESYTKSDRDPVVISNFDGRMGVDYEINPKTIIGVLVAGYNNRFSMSANNVAHTFVDQQPDSSTIIKNSEVHELTNYSANFNLQHNFSGEEKLIVNLEYIYYKDKNPVKYLNSFYLGNGSFLYDQEMRSNKQTPIKFWTGNADYTKKLGKGVDLESGVKGTISRFVNDVTIERLQQTLWATDAELTANYSLRESIMAGYISLNLTMGPKISSKMGMRYEYTNSNLGSAVEKNIVDRHYGNLFPSFFVSYNINDKNSLNFSYSKRITRPTFNDMAPFVIFMDPNTFFSGNPALQPSTSDALKLDYRFKKVILSAAYTYEARPITNFSPRVDSVTNKQTFAAENQKNQKTVAVTLSLPFRVTSWWNMQYNLIGTLQELNAYYLGSPLRIRQKNFNINAIQTFNLPKEFVIELSGFYQSAGMFGVYELEAFGSMDLGLQKKFNDKKSSLRFAVGNVFGPPIFKPSIIAPEQNLYVTGALQFTNRTFRLIYTRSFGNAKVTAKRERSTGSEDEKNRVQSNN